MGYLCNNVCKSLVEPTYPYSFNGELIAVQIHTKMVRMAGLEPATIFIPNEVGYQLPYTLNKLLNLESSTGFEPVALWFVATHSIQMS